MTVKADAIVVLARVVRPLKRRLCIYGAFTINA